MFNPKTDEQLALLLILCSILLTLCAPAIVITAYRIAL